jgi:phage baseplate assembly protein V
MIGQLQKLIAPLNRRVRLMIARGVLSLIDDAPGVQKVQVKLLAGEVRDGLERVQQYGFSSVPPVGSEAVVIFVGGNRDHGVVIGTEARGQRHAGQAAGTVAVYDSAGHVIVLTPSGIQIDGGGHEITITNCPKITQDGDIVVTGDVVANGISLHDHVHGGVQSGGSTTGAPQ